MKRRTSIGDGGSSKRRTRSVGVTGQPDIHAVGEFVKDVPQVMCLDSLEGLDRERPALLRQFIAVEYRNKNYRVSREFGRYCCFAWLAGSTMLGLNNFK